MLRKRRRAQATPPPPDPIKEAEQILRDNPQLMDEVMRKIRDDPDYARQLYKDCPHLQEILNQHADLRPVFEDPVIVRKCFEKVYVDNGGVLSDDEDGTSVSDSVDEEDKEREERRAKRIARFGLFMRIVGIISALVRCACITKLIYSCFSGGDAAAAPAGEAAATQLNLAAEALEQPGAQEEVAAMCASDEALQEAIDKDPKLQDMRDSNPIAAELMKDPEGMKILMDPDNLRAVGEIPSAMEADFMSSMGADVNANSAGIDFGGDVGGAAAAEALDIDIDGGDADPEAQDEPKDEQKQEEKDEERSKYTRQSSSAVELETSSRSIQIDNNNDPANDLDLDMDVDPEEQAELDVEGEAEAEAEAEAEPEGEGDGEGEEGEGEEEDEEIPEELEEFEVEEEEDGGDKEKKGKQKQQKKEEKSGDDDGEAGEGGFRGFLQTAAEFGGGLVGGMLAEEFAADLGFGGDDEVDVEEGMLEEEEEEDDIVEGLQEEFEMEEEAEDKKKKAIGPQDGGAPEEEGGEAGGFFRGAGMGFLAGAGAAAIGVAGGLALDGVLGALDSEVADVVAEEAEAAMEEYEEEEEEDEDEDDDEETGTMSSGTRDTDTRDTGTLDNETGDSGTRQQDSSEPYGSSDPYETYTSRSSEDNDEMGFVSQPPPTRTMESAQLNTSQPSLQASVDMPYFVPPVAMGAPAPAPAPARSGARQTNPTPYHGDNYDDDDDDDYSTDLESRVNTLDDDEWSGSYLTSHASAFGDTGLGSSRNTGFEEVNPDEEEEYYGEGKPPGEVRMRGKGMPTSPHYDYGTEQTSGTTATQRQGQSSTPWRLDESSLDFSAASRREVSSVSLYGAAGASARQQQVSVQTPVAPIPPRRAISSDMLTTVMEEDEASSQDRRRSPQTPNNATLRSDRRGGDQRQTRSSRLNRFAYWDS